MSELIPFFDRTKDKLKEKEGEIVVVPRNHPTTSRTTGAIVQVRKKEVKINGRKMMIDPHQLMRMVKQITQTIGDYKNMDNSYALYVIKSLRQARSDMVSDLEHHFGIHWRIEDGTSCFYL